MYLGINVGGRVTISNSQKGCVPECIVSKVSFKYMLKFYLKYTAVVCVAQFVVQYIYPTDLALVLKVNKLTCYYFHSNQM